MRTNIAAGNWKMNKTPRQARELACGVVEGVTGLRGVEVVVAPTMVCLPVVSEAVAKSDVHLSGQNMHWAENGAYTGEVSPAMLREVGCSHVIIGHSERRQYFGEDDAFINRKVRSALSHELVPIVCIGETLEERESGRMQEKVDFQVRAALAGVSEDDLKDVVIAYEPIWAIGTGRTASPEQAQEVHAAIRSLLSDLFDDETAQAIRILYGGSVKPKNIDELIAQEDIDGALVGGASLEADSFTAIAKACANA